MSEGPTKETTPGFETPSEAGTTPESIEGLALVEVILRLGRELAESHENFPFPGIERGPYQRMKAAEAEYPGYTTDVDVLIERCRREGIKVVLGQYPESKNIFILPAGSGDTRNDSIPPSILGIAPMMNERLKELVLAHRRRSAV